MIVLVNADSPDQVKYTLPPDDAMFASHLAGLSDNRIGARHWQKRRCGKLGPTFWAYRRRLGSYLGEGWYGYDRRKYLEVPC